MGEAIGDFLPAAVGIAISPFPIIAVILILVGSRSRATGPAYLAGFVIGVAGVGATMLLFANTIGATDESGPAAWVSWLKLVGGVLLLLLALKQWRSRPAAGEEPATPNWMGALDGYGPGKAAGAGVVLAAVNPKNLLLIAAGVAAIAETGISTREQAGALLVFAAIASLGVAAPVVMFAVRGERAREPLEALKNWMARNNAVIMTVILLLLGAKLVGDAILEL